MKTADAGYMTRRLVDVAQDVVINEEDCCTINGIDYTAIKDGDEIKVPLSKRIEGHYTIERVVNAKGELICDVNQYIDEAMAKKIEAAGVEKVIFVLSVTVRTLHATRLLKLVKQLVLSLLSQSVSLVHSLHFVPSTRVVRLRCQQTITRLF